MMNAEEYITCPHCGKENLVLSTRCIYCKQDLDPVSEPASMPAAHDEDLSDILEALAEEETDSAQAAEGEPEGLPMPPARPLPSAAEPAASQAEPAPEEEIPAWLAHVRKRAQAEGDARGLYTRDSKSSSPEDGMQNAKTDQAFDSWMGKLHEERVEPEPSASAESGDEMPVWLKRVRDLQLKPDEDQISKPRGLEAWKEEWSEEDLERLERGEFDEEELLQPSLLNAVPLPEEDAASKDSAVEEDLAESPEEVEEIQEPTPLAEATEPETVDAAEEEALPDEPALGSSESTEYEELALLQTIVDAESKQIQEPSPVKPKEPDKLRWVAVILLIALLIAFLLFYRQRPAPAPLKGAANLAFWSRLDQIGETEPVLLILDYQASSVGELEAVALPVLKALDEQKAKPQFLSLWPDGLWLGRELISAASLPAETPLDYLPGANLLMVNTALGLPAQSATGTGSNSLLGAGLEMRRFNTVIYLSDNPEAARAWVEQVGSSLEPETVLLVSTQAGQPLLLPYYDSLQIAGVNSSPFHPKDGLLAGPLPAAAAPAFEAGMGLMAAALAFSFFSKLLSKPKGRP